MQSLFMRIYGYVQLLFGVLPQSARGSKTLFLVAHYGGVLVITVLLGWFSHRIIDPAGLGLEWEWVKQYWLGILFLLSYLFIRLLIFLINLLLIQDEPEFRDIDRCWQIGTSELQRAGLDLTYLPVFLVNGMSVEDEASVFNSSGMPWKVVAPAFEDRAAVLRFFATDDALFISLTGVGTTATQRMERPVMQAGGSPTLRGGGGGGAPMHRGTLQPDQLRAAQQAAPPPAAPAAPLGGKTLPAGFRQQGGVLGGLNPAPVAASAGGPQRTMMAPGMAGGGQMSAGAQATSLPRSVMYINPISPEDRQRGERRMTYLTYLLKRDRTPYCPLNGVLQVIPLTWASDSRQISDVTPSIADDLRVLSNELELLSPLVVVYTELDKLPGFEEFLGRCSRQDGRFRDTRAGSRFPAGKPVNDETARWVVEKCLNWFQGWTYSGLAQDIDSASNSKLYRLLCELNDRRARFEQQLKELKVSGSDQGTMNWRLSGCYFVASGSGTARTSFTNGVLQRLIGDQSEVSWSDRLLRRDSRARLVGWLLLTLGLLLAVANAAAVWYFTQGGTTPPPT